MENKARINIGDLTTRILVEFAELKSYQIATYQMLKRQLPELESEKIDVARNIVFNQNLLDYAEDGILSLDPSAMEVINSEIASSEERLSAIRSELKQSE